MKDQLYKKDNRGNLVPVTLSREMPSSQIRREIERLKDSKAQNAIRALVYPESGITTFDSDGGSNLDSGSGTSVTATGSTTDRTLQDRWGEIKNVKDFGATGDGSTDDTAAIQAAIGAAGLGGRILFPNGTYKCSGLTQSDRYQQFVAEGGAVDLTKNANGSILTVAGDDVQIHGVRFLGDAASPTFTGHNLEASGDHLHLINCASQWAYGRAVKSTGNALEIVGHKEIYQTADGAGEGDPMSGTHTGSSGASVLTDSTADFGAIDSLVNYQIRNDTDSCGGVITGNTSTTVTCSGGLAGGTDNDWDASDAYTIPATGAYDIEVGQIGTATLYHQLTGIYTSQSAGGIKLVDVGAASIVGSQFGKLTVAAGTRPAGSGVTTVVACRINGDVSVAMSGSIVSATAFGAVGVTIEHNNSGIRFDLSNVYSGGHTFKNHGNSNNSIMREVSTGTYNKIKYGDDDSGAVLQIYHGDAGLANVGGWFEFSGPIDNFRLRRTTAPATPASGLVALYFDSADGNLKAKFDDGDTMILANQTPSTYAATNISAVRAFDADSTTTAELADVLGTLIVDLRTAGIVA